MGGCVNKNLENKGGTCAYRRADHVANLSSIKIVLFGFKLGALSVANIVD